MQSFAEGQGYTDLINNSPRIRYKAVLADLFFRQTFSFMIRYQNMLTLRSHQQLLQSNPSPSLQSYIPSLIHHSLNSFKSRWYHRKRKATKKSCLTLYFCIFFGSPNHCYYCYSDDCYYCDCCYDFVIRHPSVKRRRGTEALGSRPIQSLKPS